MAENKENVKFEPYIKPEQKMLSLLIVKFEVIWDEGIFIKFNRCVIRRKSNIN